MQKTPHKKSELSREELESRITALQETEKKLDEEITALEQKGIKERVAGDIMNALHEYNEMKDTLGDIFNFLSNINQMSVAELHKKYDVPLD